MGRGSNSSAQGAILRGAATDAYGAIDRRWWQRYLREHGPYFYHLTHRDHAQAIAREGLRPWDDDPLAPRSPFTRDLRPRPGHVYAACDVESFDEAHEICGLHDADGARVTIDMRLVHPARLVPDEDSLLQLADAQARWGLDTRMVADYPSGGQWAEAVRLGAQPQIVEWAITHERVIAIRGAIAPEAICVSYPRKVVRRLPAGGTHTCWSYDDPSRSR